MGKYPVWEIRLWYLTAVAAVYKTHLFLEFFEKEIIDIYNGLVDLDEFTS
jgi:hypothetical protein